MRHPVRVLLPVIVLLVAAVCAKAQLTISDVRGWGTWNAHISRADFNVTVDGLLARTQLTIDFKDTISSATFDSLELVFRFALPENSVVDSMYLWIDGAPVPALLLQREYATRIYEQIVSRRRDPAFLTRTGSSSNYELRVFPFKRRETRTVRICYYQPLTQNAEQLALSVPVTLVAPSVYAPGLVSVTVTHKESSPSALSLSLPRNFSVSQWQYVNSNTVITTSARQIRPDSPLGLLIADSLLDSTGLRFQFHELSSGEYVFTGLIIPGRLAKYTGSASSFYPAALTVSGSGTGFVYDLFGPVGTTVPTFQAVSFTGRLRGSSALAISLNGIAGGVEYTYRGQVSPGSPRSTDKGVPALWADKKVTSIGMPGHVNAYGDVIATDLSLTSRILTAYTALLALEPGMEIGIADGNGSSNITTDVLKVKHTAMTGSVALRVTRQQSAILFELQGADESDDIVLKIYDVKGRLIAELRPDRSGAVRTALWNTAGVPAGTYVARVSIGGNTIVKNLTVAR